MVLLKRAPFNTGTKSALFNFMPIPISNKVVTIKARNCKQKKEITIKKLSSKEIPLLI